MRKFWKFATVLMTFLLAFLFGACSGSSGDENNVENFGEKTTETNDTTTETGKTTLKEFSVSILIDGEKATENSSLENETAKTLSFAYSDSENGTTDGLPSVTAKWEVVSGAKYASLSANEGAEIQITDTNYSDFVQPVNLRLTITPEKETYKTATVTLKLNASVLAKKDIAATILYDGENVTETPKLKSVSDVLLSYSLGSENASEIGASAKWEFKSGRSYVIGTNNNSNLSVFNANCSGKNQEVTIKLTLTPNNWAYNATSTSITFITEDSTADLQPEEFSASVELNCPYELGGRYDGAVKISWTKSKNADRYYIYRNSKQIACVTDNLYYLDGDYSSDISSDEILTYYVKAVNLELSSTTAPADVSVSSLVPSKPTNFYSIPIKDSDGYYFMSLTWDYNQYQKFEVYRLVSASNSVSADDVVKKGKRIYLSDDSYKASSLYSYSYEARDYLFLDEISYSSYYVHYVVVAIKDYNLTTPYVTVQSAPSTPYYANCSYLVGKSSKPLDSPETTGRTSSGTSSSGGSSSTSTSVEVHCIPCHGSGKCPKCNGDGKYYKSGVNHGEYKCDRCSGTGKCPYCHGTGRK